MRQFAPPAVAIMALALTLAAAASPAKAQRPPATAAVVKAGDLFDAEQGRMVGAREILIRGDRIVEVAASVSAPPDATVIDLSQCRVMPGLIDAHTHLLLTQEAGEGLSEVAARDHAVDGDGYRLLTAAQYAREYLEAGITSVRDLGNSGRFLDLVLARAINEGRVAGPRIHGAGPGLAPAGGQMEPLPHDPHGLVDGEYRIIEGVDDARAAVREAVAAGARVIKIYPEATPQRTRLSPEEMTAIVAEARRHDMPVAAHVTSDRGAREAIEAGVTSLEHGYDLSDETLALMAERGVWWVPTHTSFGMARELSSAWPQPPSDQMIRDHLSEEHRRLRKARAAGVRIAAGQDLYAPTAVGRGRASLRVLDAYVEAGLTPAEALQTATLNAGRLLAGEGQLGVIAPGALADLIALPADPTQSLDALAGITLVMKGGRVEVADGSGACASR
ncbi:amidohydrolase family protein [Brevundimonas sp.]|uniref:amidohydrolase family protein n=1 Tax=Brevundimonas sp. TaxID=1871086 RepID=UPI0035ADC6B2